jgi:hypothetical protein
MREATNVEVPNWPRAKIPSVVIKARVSKANAERSTNLAENCQIRQANVVHIAAANVFTAIM